MEKSNVEDIKTSSQGLRGKLMAELKEDAPYFSEDSFQLLKFHGSYQQDDRDERLLRRKAGLEKAWQFMVRSKIPGGDLTTAQYLAHDRLAGDLANGTLRLTNRQDIQLHGILKGSLKACLGAINASGLTTWGACGDIVRNTTACAVPVMDRPHQRVQELANQINHSFYAQSRAYARIWLDGEEIIDSDEMGEPFYGEAYLPRKFKVGIAVPPENDVDVFSNDVALIAIVEDGDITGYNVYVGGSFGMSHGQIQTEPALAQALLFVEEDRVMDMLKVIVTIQKEYGRRDDRKQARMKYLIRDRGLIWFRDEVAKRWGDTVHPIRSVSLGTVADHLGWHKQGDGKFFAGIWVPDGRVADRDHCQFRTAFRQICERFSLSLRITPNANLYFYNIDPETRSRVEEILRKHGVVCGSDFSAARQMSHACVAHPTCGLALAESERVFQSFMDQFDETLVDLNLWSQPILVRMSGCPNGCSRPYNADFALVGRAPGKYALYVGGSSRGDHLAGLEKRSMNVEEIHRKIRQILTQYVEERLPEEAFGDFWRRIHGQSSTPVAAQFHIERAEREVEAHPCA